MKVCAHEKKTWINRDFDWFLKENAHREIMIRGV
jgi:hypothetical protein